MLIAYPSAVSRTLHTLSGGVCLAEPGKNRLYAMTVRVGVTVRSPHLRPQHDVVSLVFALRASMPRRYLDADCRHEDGFATLTQ